MKNRIMNLQTPTNWGFVLTLFFPNQKNLSSPSSYGVEDGTDRGKTEEVYIIGEFIRDEEVHHLFHVQYESDSDDEDMELW